MKSTYFKYLIICGLTLITLLLTLACFKPGFKAEQLKFPRVREAFAEKEATVMQLLSVPKLTTSGLKLIVVAYKQESQMELWASNSTGKPFLLLKTYTICDKSGELGPKRKEGDGQVPEGLYYIDRFNPNSSYHLSLGLNYPNASDKILSAAKPGGDIFIHGKCVTIGCMPMTDDKIKEIYALAVIAKEAGQGNIPVYVFPTRMDADGMHNLKINFAGDHELIEFWTNLKICYDRFQATHQPVPFTVDTYGRYVMK